MMSTPACPICEKPVAERNINAHIDSGCQDHIQTEEPQSKSQPLPLSTQTPGKRVANFFSRVTPNRQHEHASSSATQAEPPPSTSTKPVTTTSWSQGSNGAASSFTKPQADTTESAEQRKRSVDAIAEESNGAEPGQGPAKRAKPNHLEKAAPLAERCRPKSLDEVCGQDLVGPDGVLRGLIEAGRVPSMILWGSPGSGKTTIARLMASAAGTRFVEVNSASTGVAECKKLFAQAQSELGLTGRKTIMFCDEIHRFSRSQQDVLLGPVEAGIITLIGATTSNPSFSLTGALLSRCRVFVLAKLTEADILKILQQALEAERAKDDATPTPTTNDLLDTSMLSYLSAFSDGDARTALNLLELALDLSLRPNMTAPRLKHALTHTFVYDRVGDQHYDTISAFHKSIRGSDPDATLYYLARMLQSGEDPRYIARRMVVIASEDVGLADTTNSMLPLAMAAYDAAEKIGMPEARINLAHVAVALALAPKSTRAYRGLNNAVAAMKEPGIAGLPIPIHLRNAPTKLMQELGYGKEYKYNPDYVEGKVAQEYLPEKLMGRTFLEERDLGESVDPEFVEPDGFPVIYDD